MFPCRSAHVSQSPALSHRVSGERKCRYNWHRASSLWWPFPMLKSKYIFQIKYTEAILSISTRKLLSLWFGSTKMLITVKKFIVLFIIILGTLSFPTGLNDVRQCDAMCEVHIGLRVFMQHSSLVQFSSCDVNEAVAVVLECI